MIDMNSQPSPGERPSTGPVFDIESIDPLIRPLVPYFAELTTERIDGLRASLEQGAFEQIKRLAHTIKGSAASYGFPHFAEIAASIEQAIKSPDPAAQLPVLIDRLGAMHGELLTKIRECPELFKEDGDESEAGA